VVEWKGTITVKVMDFIAFQPDNFPDSKGLHEFLRKNTCCNKVYLPGMGALIPLKNQVFHRLNRPCIPM